MFDHHNAGGRNGKGKLCSKYSINCPKWCGKHDKDGGDSWL